MWKDGTKIIGARYYNSENWYFETNFKSLETRRDTEPILLQYQQGGRCKGQTTLVRLKELQEAEFHMQGLRCTKSASHLDVLLHIFWWNPVASFLVGETWKDIMAASIVSFSSRGSNPISPDILKIIIKTTVQDLFFLWLSLRTCIEIYYLGDAQPDLTTPGVDILASWSPVSPPSIYWGTPGV
ncbi:hypothetical protein GH714_005572 [Hevea brasiliensis]|uniref:Uncharacterized protein n=1 Tax=Hevea brasiliensis TaxID=3981 RepID=A0A6A6LE52_HEVBR|nr:hypothetical protein GH714_005502 [Hevea brasiliensis]KAF2297929.1 hypothetical protein GH714_005572 [Hevea brasiliensis]